MQQSVSHLFDQSHIEVRLLQQSQILIPPVWVHQNGGRHAAFNQVLDSSRSGGLCSVRSDPASRIQVNDAVDHGCNGQAAPARVEQCIPRNVPLRRLKALLHSTIVASRPAAANVSPTSLAQFCDDDEGDFASYLYERKATPSCYQSKHPYTQVIGG